MQFMILISIRIRSRISDLCVGEMVVEHLEDPYRQLDKGGKLNIVIIMSIKDCIEHSMFGLHLM